MHGFRPAFRNLHPNLQRYYLRLLSKGKCSFQQPQALLQGQWGLSPQAEQLQEKTTLITDLTKQAAQDGQPRDDRTDSFIRFIILRISQKKRKKKERPHTHAEKQRRAPFSPSPPSFQLAHARNFQFHFQWVCELVHLNQCLLLFWISTMFCCSALHVL